MTVIQDGWSHRANGGGRKAAKPVVNLAEAWTELGLQSASLKVLEPSPHPLDSVAIKHGFVRDKN